MFITRKRLNELLTQAADKAREEMLISERFNDIYRYIEDEKRTVQQELTELHRRIDAVAANIASN